MNQRTKNLWVIPFKVTARLESKMKKRNTIQKTSARGLVNQRSEYDHRSLEEALEQIRDEIPKIATAHQDLIGCCTQDHPMKPCRHQLQRNK